MPTPKPSAPAMLDDSWPMSDAELQKQAGRPNRPNSPPPPEEDALTLAAAQQKLQRKVQELAKVGDRRGLADLTIEIQKLRVVCMLLSESEAGNKVFDPNTYREMSMLNRMLGKGGGDEDDPDNPDNDLNGLKLEAEATARLAKRGITPEGAGRLARVLGAVISRAKEAPPKADDEDEGDEPDMRESVQ